jgi:hypothetical protein
MTRRKASHAPPSPVPKEHPRAWNSALWDHVETIRTLRRSRKTWKEVAGHLEKAHGLKLSDRTIRNFYVRYTARLRAGTLPAGYEPEPQPTPLPPEPQTPTRSPRPAAMSKAELTKKVPTPIPYKHGTH